MPNITSSKWIVTLAVALGASVGAAGIASAASGGSAASSSQTPSSAPAGGWQAGQPPQDPAKLGHGPGETLLTGSTATKVRAAALAAVPGATVIRVETDSAGSPYEAHLRKADGSEVTVKVSSSFTATATQSGFGGPPR